MVALVVWCVVLTFLVFLLCVFTICKKSEYRETELVVYNEKSATLGVTP